MTGQGGADTARARPARGAELELEIESLAYGGEGVARIGESGYVVFVAGAIPGDRVRAHVYKSKRAYAHARTLEILSPSPERIAPLAPHPGAPWQVLPYERQLEIKSEQVREALARIGGLADFKLEQIVPARERWRYRNKLEFSFGSDERGEVLLGFHAPARWNRVIAIEDCLLASERVNRVLRAAAAWAREQGLAAWERAAAPRGAQGAGASRPPGAAYPDGRARLRNLVVREGRASATVQVRLVTTPGELDADRLLAALAGALPDRELAGVLWSRSERPAETTAGGQTELLHGNTVLHERLGELAFQIAPEAFFQTNTEMAEILYAIASDFAALSGRELLFDLYCGLGSIGLCLAGGARRIVGVELSEVAVAGARRAAIENGIDNASFHAGEVRKLLPELLEHHGAPDVVIVDPPRAGLGRRVLDALIGAAPARIVYVSCNPTTLASDAARLAQAGWALERVRPVDMFPQTHHIECVAQLVRSA
jgi:23S rRNA (uracil1939-C5)-methyltransferase